MRTAVFASVFFLLVLPAVALAEPFSSSAGAADANHAKNMLAAAAIGGAAVAVAAGGRATLNSGSLGYYKLKITKAIGNLLAPLALLQEIANYTAGRTYWLFDDVHGKVTRVIRKITMAIDSLSGALYLANTASLPDWSADPKRKKKLMKRLRENSNDLSVAVHHFAEAAESVRSIFWRVVKRLMSLPPKPSSSVIKSLMERIDKLFMALDGFRDPETGEKGPGLRDEAREVSRTASRLLSGIEGLFAGPVPKPAPANKCALKKK
ncbi:MAG: hypothetical protein QXD77_01125 [Candidatus Aenigmatarchaeota archaeon]